MLSILLIEPSESHQENLREYLELEGYSIDVLKEPEHLISTISSSKPDLIILNEITYNGQTNKLMSQIESLGISILLLNEDGKSKRKGVVATLPLPLSSENLLSAIQKIIPKAEKGRKH